MEGIHRNRMVAVRGPQTRRPSTESSRSATPSHIQVCVQVGTRWDGYVPLQEADLDSTSASLCRNTSHSCPNLSARVAITRPPERRTSAAETLAKGSGIKCSPPPVGLGFPLSWSANLCPLDDERQGFLSPSDLGPVASTTADLPPSPSLEVPLEVLMSRRDSRRMQDLTLLPKTKPNTYLKVHSASSSASSVSSSPSPKGLFTSRGFLAAEANPLPPQQTSNCPEIFINTDQEFLVLRAAGDEGPEPPPDHAHRPPHARPHTAHGLEHTQTRDGTTRDDVDARESHTLQGYRKKSGERAPSRRGVQNLEEPAGDNSGRARQARRSVSGSRDIRRKEAQVHQPPPRVVEMQEGAGVQPPSPGPPTYNTNPGHRRSLVYSDDNISYVMAGLYVGNIRAAYCEPILCRLRVQCVVDLSNVLPSQVPAGEKSICPCSCPLKTAHHRSRLCINIPDSEDIDLTQFMTEVNRFMEGALRNTKSVLVHSYHGKSRAPAVVMQYLMTVHHMPLNKASSLVRTAHRPVAINKGFLRTLQQLERRLSPAQPPSLNTQSQAAIPSLPKTRSAWN